MRLSIIIPVLNEAELVVDCLRPLAYFRQAGHEVIVVDGGSEDDTARRAKGWCDVLVPSLQRGRAVQMHAGALRARGDILLFLHADTRLPDEAAGLFECLPSAPEQGVASAAGMTSGRGAVIVGSTPADECPQLWGRFDVRLSSPRPVFRLVETLINLRSRWSGIATGDQAIFASRALYLRVGGFPPLDLMEDIALSRALRAIQPPLCLRYAVTTSSRRWERRGVVRTILTMWCLRGLYACGVSPTRLANWYR